MRVADDVPSLRSKPLFPALRAALALGSRRAFRVVHFSLQTNHVHLLVEADSFCALSRGMQGLATRLAKVVNRVAGRRGRVWSDRYHSRALRTPREVHHGLVYVLLNGRKHRVSGRGVDACSSGPWFRGWRESVRPPSNPSPVAPARTWLLAVGWRRWGSIGFDAVPG